MPVESVELPEFRHGVRDRITAGARGADTLAGWGAAPAGRAQELAAIERLLDSELPGAIVIQGEAGIGKSTVWGAGVALALDRGRLVLSARGSESETALSYAGLADLLEPVADPLLDRLPVPQREALEVVLLRRQPGSTPLAQRAIGAAVLGVLRELARDRPVLLAIDDLQWFDQSSSDALAFALRRLDREPVAMLAGRRLAGGLAAPVTEQASQQVAGALPTERIDLRPLPDSVIERLLADRLRLVLPARQLSRLLERVAGNPFWALEVGAALTDPAADLPVPESLSSLVGQRVAALDPAAHQALLVVSALHQPNTDLVVRALRDEVPDPQAALDAAVSATVVAATNTRLRPAHPLLGSVALQSLPPGRRARLHRRLADLVADPEQHARHLALAAAGVRNAEVAAALDAGARAARDRGATHAAAELMELAIQHTPAGRTADLAERQRSAAELYFATGTMDRARELAEAAFAPDRPLPIRRRTLNMLVEVTYWARGPQAAQELVRSILDTPGTDPHLHAIALAAAADVGDGHGSERAALAGRALQAFDRLDEDPDPAALTTALVYQAQAQLEAGNGLAQDVLDRAIAAQERLAWVPLTTRVRVTAAFWLKSVDRLDESREALQALIVQARNEGEDGALPAFYGHLALTECWAGRYADGLAAIDNGLRHAESGGQVPAVLHAAHALLLLLTGETDQACDLMNARMAAEPAISAQKATVYQQVLGAAALLGGDNDEAVRLLGAALATARAAGLHEPGRRQRLEGDLGQALVNVGRFDEAAELAAELRSLGERQQRPTITGVGLRIAGLVSAGQGRLDEAVSVLQQAVSQHERSPLPLELGRTLLALGRVHRRRRSRLAARETLERAAARFAELGAVPFAALTTAELSRLGGTRAAGGLTEAERRIAQLVASGLSNRDVAARLFMSVRTVEGHLAAVYRKVGVRSRTELARRLGSTDVG